MGKPYSQDLRERVIAAVDTGTGAYVAAPLFQVSVSYIYKALIRRRKTGEVTARRSGGVPNRSWRRTMMPFVHALRPNPTSRSPNCRLGYSPSARSTSASGVCGTGLSFSNSRSKKVGASRRAGSLRCGPSA